MERRANMTQQTELDKLRKIADESWTEYTEAYKRANKFRTTIKPSFQSEWNTLNDAYKKDAFLITQEIKRLKDRRLQLQRKLRDDLKYIRKDRRKKLRENIDYQTLIKSYKDLFDKATNDYRIWNDAYAQLNKEKEGSLKD